MKNTLLLLVVLLSNLPQTQAQISNLWRADAEMMTYDRQRVYEAPSGNVVHARMDDYYGIGDGNDLLRCFSPDGTLLWAFGEEDFTDNSASNFIDIDIDSEGNTYIAGSNFPQTASYPKSEVIKISPTGEELWRINFTQQSTWSEKAYQIEITDEGRIFLLAQLYNADAQTIIPYFIEINAAGETLQYIPDTNFVIAYSTLFAPGDGFLYAADDLHIIKLNYDGTLVWDQPFTYGEGTNGYFGYQTAEFNVRFMDGKIYTCQEVYDPNSMEQQFGISVFTLDGVADVYTYTILPDMQELNGVKPRFLDIDDSHNIFVTGDYLYGDFQGPTIADGDDRGGKGSTYRGSFTTRIDNAYTQNWTINYPESTGADSRYAIGTFLYQNKITVAYHSGDSDGPDQRIECYDNTTSAISWSHNELSNDVFAHSTPKGLLIGSDGDLYTFGTGDNPSEFGFDYSIYLYKYDLIISSINTLNKSEQIALWPNPANDFLNIQSTNNIETLEIYNYMGQLCISENMNTLQATLDITSLSAGVYVIKLSGKKHAAIEFIKK